MKVCIAFGLSPRCRGDKNSKSYLLFEALFQSQLKGIVTFTTHQKPWAAPHEISRWARARVEGAGSRDNHAHGASTRRQGARTGQNVRLPSARRPCESRVHNDSRRVSGTTALASTEAARWQSAGPNGRASIICAVHVQHSGTLCHAHNQNRLIVTVRPSDVPARSQCVTLNLKP